MLATFVLPFAQYHAVNERCFVTLATAKLDQLATQNSAGLRINRYGYPLDVVIRGTLSGRPQNHPVLPKRQMWIAKKWLLRNIGGQRVEFDARYSWAAWRWPQTLERICIFHWPNPELTQAPPNLLRLLGERRICPRLSHVRLTAESPRALSLPC